MHNSLLHVLRLKLVCLSMKFQETVQAKICKMLLTYILSPTLVSECMAGVVNNVSYRKLDTNSLLVFVIQRH